MQAYIHTVTYRHAYPNLYPSPDSFPYPYIRTPYMHAYTPTYIHAHMLTCVHAYVAYIHACMHAYVRTDIHTCTHVCTCLHTCIYGRLASLSSDIGCAGHPVDVEATLDVPPPPPPMVPSTAPPSANCRLWIGNLPSDSSRHSSRV